MTIVTASSRLARSLRREDDVARRGAGEKIWESQDILPWDAWIARLWSEAIYEGAQQRLLLSNAQELVLWEQAVAASPEAEGLLNPAGAAQLASEARKLIYNWRLPQEASAFQGIPDAEAFLGWMRSFEASVKQRGFITAAEVPGELSRSSGIGFVSYAGFDVLTPVQKRLFETYGAIPLLQPSPAWEPDRIRMGIPSAGEELLAAATWARSKLEADAEASIGVVIPDLASRRASVERTFYEVMGGEGAYHLSAPAPLSESPLVTAALLAIRLLSGLSAGEYGLLLRSPYFRFTAQEGAVADLAMRRMGILRATLAQSEMASLFPRLAPAFAEVSKTQRASNWSRTFSQLVRASSWPGTREWNSAEYQAIESWKNLLGEFSRLDAVLGEIGFDDALRRLDRLAEETFFGPADEDEPVQVMGVLEAAGAQFDALWIAGLDDRVWPPSAKPNPFVPIALQRAAGSPGSSAEQQSAYAARVTARLLAAAPEVICGYPEREGEEMLRPSPLIAALPELAYNRALILFEAAALEVVNEDAAPPLAGNTVQRGGMNVIADQSACPFRAFARHRLHARSLDVVEPGLTARERGIVTHKVLELIWSELRTQKALLERSSSELRELVQKSVRSALRSGLGIESRKMTQMQALEEERLAGVLHDWLEIEKRRPGFEVIGQEISGQFRPGGLELNIKTDRVDRYTSDGTLAIIDYKTGVTDTLGDWAGDRPKSPQVPLYCVAADEAVSTAVFGRLAAGKTQFIGYSDREQAGAKAVDREELQAMVAGWRQTLEILGAEFIRGEARVQPALRTTCRLCDLQPLCRISAVEPDEDEASE